MARTESEQSWDLAPGSEPAGGTNPAAGGGGEPPIGGTGTADASLPEVPTGSGPGEPVAPRPVGRAVPATRASAVWTAVVVGLVLLAAVLAFIVQNLQDVDVAFFGAHWRIPLGVDLLLAAVLGGLVTVAAGAVRLLQLRRVARRHARAGERR